MHSHLDSLVQILALIASLPVSCWALKGIGMAGGRGGALVAAAVAAWAEEPTCSYRLFDPEAWRVMIPSRLCFQLCQLRGRRCREGLVSSAALPW